MFKFVKSHFNSVGKLFLTIYLCYGAYALWNIKLGLLMQPLELFIVICTQITYSASISIYLYFLWFKKSESDKLFRNIIIATTIITIFSFPITYGLLILGRNLSHFDGVRIGTPDGWLAFIGSILGGIITMAAVVFTINNERKIREEDEVKHLEYQKNNLMPIIDLDFPINPDGSIKHSTDVYINIFIIRNESSCHALIQNLDIINYTFFTEDHSEELLNFERNTIKDSIDQLPDIQILENTVIPGNSSKNFPFIIRLPDKINDYIFTNKNTSAKLLLTIDITYTDILGLQKYIQRIARIVRIYENINKDEGVYTIKVSDLKTYLPPKRVD